jgi:hypothetical protein
VGPGEWIVVLDGRERRARSAEVFCSESLVDPGAGHGSSRITPVWTVALLLDGDLYEIDRTAGIEGAKTLARVLSHEIHGDASRVWEPRVGLDAWRPEYLSAGDSGFVPLTVRACSLVIPLAVNDPRFVLVGVFAIAVRIAIVVERLANATRGSSTRKTSPRLTAERAPLARFTGSTRSEPNAPSSGRAYSCTAARRRSWCR